MDRSQVAVVILNWNGRRFLEKYLPSVINCLPQCAKVVIADNASSDDSLDFLARNYPELPVLALSKNFGYAGGYNEALRQVEAEYYVLLNSDVEVTPGWIEPVVEYLEKNAHVAAAQPKILSDEERHKFEYAGAAGGFVDVFGYPFCRGRVFDFLETDLGQHDDTTRVHWATGACLFVRAKAFREAGGFDERFFAHMEEIDLCWRLQRLGYEVVAVPSSKVFHLGGGTLPRSNPKKTYLNFRNSLWLLAKNLPSSYFYPLLPIRILLDFLAGFRFLLLGQKADAMAVAKAHLALFKNLRKMRQSAPKGNDKLPGGIYIGSVVFDFYVRKKKRFTELKWKRFGQRMSQG